MEILTAKEIARLEDFRSDRRWSYRELAGSMSDFLGVRMPEPTLIQALRAGSGLPTTVKPIKRYLNHIDAVKEAVA